MFSRKKLFKLRKCVSNYEEKEERIILLLKRCTQFSFKNS